MHMGIHPLGSEMQAMDKIVQVWASALEIWHLSRSGRPPEEWHPHMGRGVASRHKWRKLNAQTQPKAEITAEKAALVWWSRMAAMLQ